MGFFRSILEAFVFATIIIQVTVAQSSVTDTLDFTKGLKQSNSCGGILEGPAGVINYKVGQNYTKYEACVWTILAPLKPTISLRLITDGLDPYDEIQVFTTQYYTELMETRVVLAARIEGGTTNVTEVEGDLIYIVFGPYSFGTGFSLLYEGVGQDDTSGFTRSYQLLQDDGTMTSGNYSYDSAADEEGTFLEIFSFVVSSPDKLVTTSLTISNYVTEYGENESGVWWPSLTVHQFQPGSPPNVFMLLGLYHTDDAEKTFKINRPVVVYSAFVRDYPSHVDLRWTRKNNSKFTSSD